MNTNFLKILLVLITCISLSCSVGDKDLASGTYSLSIVAPDGFNHSGTAYLEQIGTLVTMQLFSTIGNFNFAGELDYSSTTGPNRFEADGSDSSRIEVEFSASRSSFAGSIETNVDTTDTGTTTYTNVYLISADKM